ncbi:hypothetical protein AB6867_26440 [Serratia proteamaculans]|uniref:hypothetical protein n=1 Tax=Serratia proteamaculans TaxID=28151 RepID=UPI0039BE84BD
MNTQNVNVKTATPKHPKRYGEGQSHYTILMAEGERGTDHADFDVCEFHSLKELQEFRKSYPEKMKNEYSYLLSSGTQPSGRHIGVVSAEHYKKFIKLVNASGITI